MKTRMTLVLFTGLSLAGLACGCASSDPGYSLTRANGYMPTECERRPDPRSRIRNRCHAYDDLVQVMAQPNVQIERRGPTGN